ncbi:hypothetical protein BH09GEM1_BH09GEM1_24900 [soil metagenome]
MDSTLATFIAGIRAVDNHAHVSSTSPADSESDALPLELLPPGTPPMRLRPERPTWLAGYRTVYGYPYADRFHGARADAAG